MEYGVEGNKKKVKFIIVLKWIFLKYFIKHTRIVSNDNFNVMSYRLSYVYSHTVFALFSAYIQLFFFLRSSQVYMDGWMNCTENENLYNKKYNNRWWGCKEDIEKKKNTRTWKLIMIKENMSGYYFHYPLCVARYGERKRGRQREKEKKAEKSQSCECNDVQLGRMMEY